MSDKIRVPLNHELQSFLAGEDYTHLYNMGVEGDRLPIKDNSDIDYIIIPLKKDDPLFNDESTAEKIEEIRSNEVFDMAHGNGFIKFIVELPVKVYEKFLKGCV